jgi:hypothetical protein
MTLTTERLEEMRRGLEGLPVGPWHADDNEADLVDGNGRWLDMDHGGGFWKHIARCDPETIRSMIDELLERRSLDKGEVVKPAYWAVHSVTGAHIGLWPKIEDAMRVWQEYQDGTLTPLYAFPQPAPKELDEKALKAAARWFAIGPDQIPVGDMVRGIVSTYLSALHLNGENAGKEG